jgi:hypothetical protein
MTAAAAQVGKNWKLSFARGCAVWVGWEKLSERFQFGGNPAGVAIKIRYLWSFGG